MSVYLRRPKLSDDTDMNEEEVQQNTTAQPQDASAQQQTDNSRDYTKEFAVVNAKIAELERRFNAEKQPLINQRTAIMQAAAKAGVSLTTNESVNYDFSTKLFESVIKNSKTDELINLIDSTFSSLPDLSYYMDKKGCTSLAKRLLAFLNDQYWNDGQNHWNDVAEFIRGTLGKANISLSTKEMMKFVDELGNQMQGHNMFVWIFGNQPAKANEVEEQPAPELPVEEPVAVEEEPELIEEPEETLYQEPVSEVPGEEDYQYDPEVHEDAVFFPGETEDQYDTRYFGDLYPDDFPEEDYSDDTPLYGEEDYELNESKSLISAGKDFRQLMTLMNYTADAVGEPTGFKSAKKSIVKDILEYISYQTNYGRSQLYKLKVFITELLMEICSSDETSADTFAEKLVSYMKWDNRFKGLFGDVMRDFEDDMRIKRDFDKRQRAREMATAMGVTGSGWRHCGYDDDTYIK